MGKFKRIIEDNSLNEVRKMSPEVLSVLRIKGYAPLLKSIDNTVRDLKAAGYYRDEILDTLLDNFGDEDPVLYKKIRSSVLGIPNG